MAAKCKNFQNLSVAFAFSSCCIVVLPRGGFNTGRCTYQCFTEWAECLQTNRGPKKIKIKIRNLNL